MEYSAWQSVSEDITIGAEFSPMPEFFENWNLTPGTVRTAETSFWGDLIRKLDWLIIPQQVYRLAAATVVILALTAVWVGTDLKIDATNQGLPNRLVLHHSYVGVSENDEQGIALVNIPNKYLFSHKKLKHDQL